MVAVEHGQMILDIAADFVRALDYSTPSDPRDLSLHKAAIRELESWGIGDAVNGVIDYLDVGLGCAEFFYPAHEFDLKIIMAICTAVMTWMDSAAEDMLEALTQFQRRFYARQPQLHPALDCYTHFILRLYDHYEPYVADAMIMSSCGFINGCCLEVRGLSERVPVKHDAKLWPYYLRSLSGASVFYAYACFPKKDHPDALDYIQAIPEILIFTNFLNDVLSFYKEEMAGEQHNYCQIMARTSKQRPIKVLQNISDETVAVSKRTKLILKDNPAALRAFEEYEQGYIRFHFDVARYRLPTSWKAQFST